MKLLTVCIIFAAAAAWAGDITVTQIVDKAVGLDAKVVIIQPEDNRGFAFVDVPFKIEGDNIRRHWRTAVFFLCLSLASSDAETVEGRSFDVEQVKKELAPLSFLSPPSYPQATRRYFEYYGLDMNEVEHFFGTFSSSTNHVLAAHVFKPRKSVATVILAHGYYDHAGILKHLIRSLVEQDFTVAVYDQPGHGLSSGERASISDFSEYRTVLDDFLKLCRENLNGPFHLVAHSMGCAIATDYLLTSDKPLIEKVVFVAPLIHSTGWTISGLGVNVTGSSVDHVPRVYRNNSSDKDFLRFMKDDPLQTDRVPIKWTKALREWNERATKYAASDKAIKIIQGEQDTTVDWKYNIPFLNRKFPKSDVSLLRKGRHQLINETQTMRDAVLKLIAEHLAAQHASSRASRDPPLAENFLVVCGGS